MSLTDPATVWRQAVSQGTSCGEYARRALRGEGRRGRATPFCLFLLDTSPEYLFSGSIYCKYVCMYVVFVCGCSYASSCCVMCMGTLYVAVLMEVL